MADTSKLEQSSELCIGALSQAVLDDIARYEELRDKDPKVLALTAELRMDTKFILMDLSTSFLAVCKAKEAYACRYHIKNLEAGIQEAYKLLLNYSKSQRYTIWKKIGNALKEDPICNWPEQEKLLSDYQDITIKFSGLAGREDDKQHRDLTYHYDADMRQVYVYTVATNSMEEAANKLIAVMEVLGKMTSFCDDIETCLKNNGTNTSVEIENQNIDESLHLTLIQYLSQNKELPFVLDGILKDVNPIDDYAHQIEVFNKLKVMTDEQHVELPEIDNVYTMLNLYLTVLFMRADMAAITKAFLFSKTSGEAMLNMRRYVITITAAFGHLYGYSEEQKAKSLWQSVLGMIPDESTVMKSEAADIEEILKKVVLKSDMDLRTSYVHLLDNQTHKTNIPTIVSQLRQQNPLIEMQKVNLMLQVIKRVMDFMKGLMTELAQLAHESNERSTAALREQMIKVKAVADNENCPGILKDKILEIIGKVQGWTGIEL